MGLFASVELFATMLAPLILGSWADRSKKLKCILILLGIQIAFAFTIFASNIQIIFIKRKHCLALGQNYIDISELSAETLLQQYSKVL